MGLVTNPKMPPSVSSICREVASSNPAEAASRHCGTPLKVTDEVTVSLARRLVIFQSVSPVFISAESYAEGVSVK